MKSQAAAMNGTEESARFSNPFTTVESAQEFLILLGAAVEATLAHVRQDLEREDPQARRTDALRLAVYKLEKLEHHVSRSHRLANDLRMLRRLFFDERAAERASAATSARR